MGRTQDGTERGSESSVREKGVPVKKWIATRIRCYVCRSEYDTGDLDLEIQGCPDCGSKLPAQDAAMDVTFTLNWHDLQCLVGWADEFILSQNQTYEREVQWERIKGLIRSHRPEGVGALTVFEKIDELRGSGVVVEYGLPEG